MDLTKKHSATEVIEEVCADGTFVQSDDVSTGQAKNMHSEPLGPPPLSAEQQRKLWRKIDMRIVPMLSALYLCCYLDRGMCGIVSTTSQRTNAYECSQGQSVRLHVASSTMEELLTPAKATLSLRA